MFKFDRLISKRSYLARKEVLALGFIISIAAMIILTPSAFSQKPLNDSEEFKITLENPKNNDSVPSSLEVNGSTIGDVPFGWHVWVLVNPRAAPGQWWPQGGGEIIPWNGKWYTQALIGGGDADIGKRFEIAAILVDEKDNSYLNRWIIETNKIQKWPSIPWPASARVPDSSKGNTSAIVIRSNPVSSA